MMEIEPNKIHVLDWTAKTLHFNAIREVGGALLWGVKARETIIAKEAVVKRDNHCLGDCDA